MQTTIENAEIFEIMFGKRLTSLANMFGRKERDLLTDYVGIGDLNVGIENLNDTEGNMDWQKPVV